MRAAGASYIPIMDELEQLIRARAGHGDAILIDDARCFTGRDGYPFLDEFLARIDRGLNVRPRVVNDVIFVLPAL